jgi:hypothetical protein
MNITRLVNKEKERNMQLEIKPLDNQYRVLFSKFDQDGEEIRLYWFEDYNSLEAAEHRISELHLLNGTE